MSRGQPRLYISKPASLHQAADLKFQPVFLFIRAICAGMSQFFLRRDVFVIIASL